jgi:thiol-disulfide isomerase/thioredoxin
MKESQIPEWKIESLTGEAVPRLEEFRGRPVLVLFYATGCPGCKARALPYANTVHWEYPELKAIGIHTRFDGPLYSNDQIKEIIAVYGLKFSIFKDQGMATFEAWAAEGTPHWVLIDREGKVMRSVFGSTPGVLQRLDFALAELGLEKEENL